MTAQGASALDGARLAPDFGIEIDIREFSGGSPEESAALLRRALIDHHLLVIRGRATRPEQQIAFSRIFGELDVLPHDPTQIAEHPEIRRIANRPGEGHLNVGRYWHSDGTYLRRQTAVSIWHAVTVPDEGGDTLFANTHAVFETLPAALRERVDGLAFVSRTGATHRLVQRHPVTGRKALYVSIGMTTRVLGVEPDESADILRRLDDHFGRPGTFYRHAWREGDIVVADNCSTAHKATVADPRHRRILHRMTVSGDAAFYWHSGSPAAASAGGGAEVSGPGPACRIFFHPKAETYFHFVSRDPALERHGWSILEWVSPRRARIARRRMEAGMRAFFGGERSAADLRAIAAANRRAQARSFLTRSLEAVGRWRPDVAIADPGRLTAALAAGRGAILWCDSFLFCPLLGRRALFESGIAVRHVWPAELGDALSAGALVSVANASGAAGPTVGLRLGAHARLRLATDPLRLARIHNVPVLPFAIFEIEPLRRYEAIVGENIAAVGNAAGEPDDVFFAEAAMRYRDWLDPLLRRHPEAWMRWAAAQPNLED